MDPPGRFSLCDGEFLLLHVGLRVRWGGVGVVMSWSRVLGPCTGQLAEEEQGERDGFCADGARRGYCLAVCGGARCHRVSDFLSLFLLFPTREGKLLDLRPQLREDV